MSGQVELLNASSRRRQVNDLLAKYGVTAGGILVLIALLLIFFYLLYVVQPLMKSASITERTQVALVDTSETLALGLDEQTQMAFRISAKGSIEFYQLSQPQGLIQQVELPAALQGVGHGLASGHDYALALGDGSVLVVEPRFEVSYPNDVRTITPNVKYPLGETPIPLSETPLVSLAYQSNADAAALLYADSHELVKLVVFAKETNMMTDETTITEARYALPKLPESHIDEVALTPNLRRAFVRSGNKVWIWDISKLDDIKLREVVAVNATGGNVTDMELLAGANSLVFTNDNGVISQWFEVAKDGERKLTQIRTFDAQMPLQAIHSEHYRKGFAVADDSGQLALYHATGQSRLADGQFAQTSLQRFAFAPRANAIVAATEQQLVVLDVDNQHPEVTWSSLWGKVWYEGYSEPDYIWQSTSASDDFEPKLSLVPISFGTLKAAFYAMLFAVPIAIAGAIFTAYFMAPSVRSYVKPTVEIMEALPTVILGFLAGLWLAPIVEEHLPGVILLILLLPLGMLLTAALWTTLPNVIRHRVPDGWQAILLIPTVLIFSWLAFALSPWFELNFMGGDTRLFLTNELGIDFDQRNSLVVGIAMGFAVVPTIFSIAEDAIFSVPRHLTNGSLALGATSWQTLVRVVLLTASPGIFSAVMMGLGRAVGETMIVLMATGNTPMMDMSIFSGMRTLAANIAVEMPESEVGSSHYRVLFLAAFVLFVFTFIFNTIAEFVRQRLRDKYSSM